MIYLGPEHFDDAKSYIEKHQLYEAALEIFHESDRLPVRVSFSRSIILIHDAPQEILSLYGEWLFERREFDQSALGMRKIIAHSSLLTDGCSVCGRAETTEGNARIRKGVVMARTLRSRAASEDRSRGSRCDGIPCSRYALLPRLATLALMIAFTEDLASKKRYTEASQVLLDYAEDVRETVIISSREISSRRRVAYRELS
jgi:elongator complex protein 1